MNYTCLALIVFWIYEAIDQFKKQMRSKYFFVL